jgi:hypothetical protein
MRSHAGPPGSELRQDSPAILACRQARPRTPAIHLPGLPCLSAHPIRGKPYRQPPSAAGEPQTSFTQYSYKVGHVQSQCAPAASEPPNGHMRRGWCKTKAARVLAGPRAHPLQRTVIFYSRLEPSARIMTNKYSEGYPGPLPAAAADSSTRRLYRGRVPSCCSPRGRRVVSMFGPYRLPHDFWVLRRYIGIALHIA